MCYCTVSGLAGKSLPPPYNEEETPPSLQEPELAIVQKETSGNEIEKNSDNIIGNDD